MSRNRRRQIQQEQQKRQKEKRWWKYVIGAFGILVALTLVFKATEQLRHSFVHAKALALGLRNAPQELEERHVWVSSHTHAAGPGKDVPMHILFRRDNAAEWILCGTGLRFGRDPNALLTAYHVFEGRRGQYGYRRIGPNEFTGTEVIHPIISCEYKGQAGDAVLCVIGTNNVTFPVIDVPISTNMFRSWAGRQKYVGLTFPAKVRLTTYPEKQIQNSLRIEVTPSEFHFVFNWKVMPGESGTAARLEGTSTDTYLVVIRSQVLPREIFEQLISANRKLLDWSEDKEYGVAICIQFDPVKVQ